MLRRTLVLDLSTAFGEFPCIRREFMRGPRYVDTTMPYHTTTLSTNPRATQYNNQSNPKITPS